MLIYINYKIYFILSIVKIAELMSLKYLPSVGYIYKSVFQVWEVSNMFQK